MRFRHWRCRWEERGREEEEFGAGGKEVDGGVWYMKSRNVVAHSKPQPFETQHRNSKSEPNANRRATRSKNAKDTPIHSHFRETAQHQRWSLDRSFVTFSYLYMSGWRCRYLGVGGWYIGLDGLDEVELYRWMDGWEESN
jgi:hypothetical protein